MPQTSPPLYMYLEEGVVGAMRRVPRLVRYAQLRGRGSGGVDLSTTVRLRLQARRRRAPIIVSCSYRPPR